VLRPEGVGMGKEGSVKSILVVIAVAAVAFACVSCGGGAARKTSLNTELEKASYAYGLDVAESMQRSGLELDVDSFVQGFTDTLTGKKVLLTNQEKAQVMQEYASKMREKQMAEMQEKAKTNMAAGRAFLAENAKKDSVMVTADSLQYQILRKGTGPKPGPEATVKVNYIGKLIDGTTFDSSYDRGQPAEFPLNGVIPGWSEAIQLMNVGAKYRFWIPADLAYGERGAPPVIGPNETLIFDIELLEIVK
jgi:FKBP-type peptidyl-prolyl cis-trans isomerase FkpA